MDEECLKSAESAEQPSKMTGVDVSVVIQPSQIHSGAKSVTTPATPQNGLSWNNAEEPLTDQMIRVLRLLADCGCDTDKLIKEKVVTKPTLGRWIKDNKTFRLYWNELIDSTRATMRAKAVNGMSEAIDVASRLLPGAEMKDVISAGKFFKDIVDSDVPEKRTLEESTKVEYDEDGKILSVTEQKRAIQQIRVRNGVIEDNG